MIAAQLFATALQQENALFLDSTNATPSHAENPAKAAADAIARKVQDIIDISSSVMIPGYTGTFPEGIIQTWGRGYSDASASNVYQSLLSGDSDRKIEFAIKKLFTICSADPRIV